MFNIAIHIIPIGFIADTFQTDRLCSDRFHTDTFHTDMFCLGTLKIPRSGGDNSSRDGMLVLESLKYLYRPVKIRSPVFVNAARASSHLRLFPFLWVFRRTAM
jgi:hypothetical protein